MAPSEERCAEMMRGQGPKIIARNQLYGQARILQQLKTQAAVDVRLGAEFLLWETSAFALKAFN